MPARPSDHPAAVDPPGTPSPGGDAPASLTGIVARGVRLAGAGYAVSQIVTFGTYFALAKLATPGQIGRFAAATIVVGVGTMLAESGMAAALIQRREEVDEAFNSALVATLASGILLTLLALASAPLIGLFFHNHEVGTVAAVMSGWMLLRLATVIPDAWLQRRFSFFRRVLIDPLAAVAFGAGTITAVAAGLGVWGLVIGTYAAALVNAGAAWALSGWRPQPHLATVAMWRDLARFGRSVVGAEFIRRLAVQFPIVVLGRFSGAAALGQFTYATRVAAQPVGAFINVGGYVLLPAFSRISAHDDRFRAAFLRALRWMCAIAFPAGLLLVPLGMPAVVLVFGAAWRQAGYGAMALGAYCAAIALDSIASEAWKAYGRPDMLARMHAVSLALTVICVGALVPFGLIGVTVGMSLGGLGVAAYAMRGVARVIEIPGRRLLQEIWPTAAAALMMVAALFPLEHLLVHADTRGTVLGLALLAGETVLGAVLYLIGLRIVSREIAGELLAALTGLRRRFARRRPPKPAQTL